MTEWPRYQFAAVPPLDIASTVAMAVRQAVLGDSNLNTPCDLTAVCSAGGFEAVTRALTGPQNKHEALLVPKVDGGFYILVDPRPQEQASENDVVTRHRARFRIAHEIGHSFFYDRSVSPSRRLTDDSSDEERFCDAFASALLIPPDVIRTLSPTVDTVMQLYRGFDVSMEVTCRAFARVFKDVYVMGLLMKKHPANGVTAPRVVWSVGPGYIPKGASIHSMAVDSAMHGTPARCRESLNVGSVRGEFLIDAAKTRTGALTLVILTRASG